VSDNIFVRGLSVDAGEFEFRAAPDGDGLTVSGYIARFNDPTQIEDWAGVYTEEIKRGAFALPVGVWSELREDRRGLFGEGRIHDTWHTIPIRAAIQSGALDGMSFKFKVVSEQVRKGDPKKSELDHRTLTEVALFEAGMVVHPAYEGTTLALRSKAMDLFRSPSIDMDVTPPVRADMLPVEKAVAPVGDTDPVRAEAGPPVGITRREMRQQALSALGVIHDSDRGAA
jgi:hypothetical protein